MDETKITTPVGFQCDDGIHCRRCAVGKYPALEREPDGLLEDAGGNYIHALYCWAGEAGSPCDTCGAMV